MSNAVERLMAMVTDPGELAERFAKRVTLAKMTLEAALEETRQEWTTVQAWIRSKSEARGSFNFLCDLFDLEPDAVRRAIAEGAK